MAEERRNFPYRIAWIVFIASMLVGAGLSLSSQPARQAWGLVLFSAPLVLFGAVLGLYYWRSRRIAQ